MSDLDTFRQSIQSLSQEKLKETESVLIALRKKLNEEQPISLEQVDRIESDLLSVNQKLQIVRAFLH